MNQQQSRPISQAYAIFLMASLALLGYSLYSIGFAGIFSRLLPVLFTICLFLFFFITGVRFYMDDQNALNIGCVEICLVIQTIQLNIMGFSLANYYGPYLAVGITDTPAFRLTGKYQLFRYWVDNGYAPGHSVSLTINCFQLALYLFFIFYQKKLRPGENAAFTETGDVWNS